MGKIKEMGGKGWNRVEMGRDRGRMGRKGGRWMKHGIKCRGKWKMEATQIKWKKQG